MLSDVSLKLQTFAVFMRFLGILRCLVKFNPRLHDVLDREQSEFGTLKLEIIQAEK